MRGKTPAEVTVQARQLAMLAAQAVQQQPTYQQPLPQQVQQTPIDPGEYLTYGALQQQGAQFVDQANRNALAAAAPAIEMAASTNLDRVKEKYAKEFHKYGPSIWTVLNRLPKDQWSIDRLTDAVKFALVPHLDELTEDRLATRLAQDPALRSSGTNGLSTSQSQPGPEAQLNDSQKAQLRRQGMKPEIIAEHAAKMGIPLDVWYKNFAKDSVGDVS